MPDYSAYLDTLQPGGWFMDSVDPEEDDKFTDIFGPISKQFRNSVRGMALPAVDDPAVLAKKRALADIALHGDVNPVPSPDLQVDLARHPSLPKTVITGQQVDATRRDYPSAAKNLDALENEMGPLPDRVRQRALDQFSNGASLDSVRSYVNQIHEQMRVAVPDRSPDKPQPLLSAGIVTTAPNYSKYLDSLAPPDYSKYLDGLQPGGDPDFSDVTGGSSSTADDLLRKKRGGLLTAGNIDVMHRPVVQNPDGTVSTVRSMSIGTDKGEVLIPTVSDDGKVLAPQAAIDLYRQTGRNLGVFDSPASATTYAQSLHQQQADLLAKRAQMAQARQLAAAQGLAGPAPDQSVGARVLAPVNRALNATADMAASIPELYGKAAEFMNPSSVDTPEGGRFGLKESPFAEVYPTIGKPGGFFDMAADRRRIQQDADTSREQMLQPNATEDPSLTAAVDTLALGASMSLPLHGLPPGAGAAEDAAPALARAAGAAEEVSPQAAKLADIFGPAAHTPEETAYLARRAEVMPSIPGAKDPFVGPGAIADSLRPESEILQVGTHPDPLSQDIALGLRARPQDAGDAAELSRVSQALDETAAPSLPRQAPPSLAEIFGDARPEMNAGSADRTALDPLRNALAQHDLQPVSEIMQAAEGPRAPLSSPLEAHGQDVFGGNGTNPEFQHQAADAAPTLRNLITREEVPLDTPSTSTKNAVTEAERIARGLPEVEAIGRKTSGEAWGQAKQIFTEQPEAARDLAVEVAAKPRALTPVENDLLLHDRMKLTLDHREALAAEDAALAAGDTEGAAAAKIQRVAAEHAMDVNDTALVRAGSESGASLQARQKLIAEDYSPLYLRQRLTVAARESGAAELPGANDALMKISKQLEEAHAKIAGYEDSLSQAEAEKAFAAMQRQVAAAERSGVRRASRADLDAEYEALGQRLDAKARKNQSTANMSGGLDPETVGIISKMAGNRVQAGGRGLGDVVDSVFQRVRNGIDGLEPREVRDAISGYGIVRPQQAQSEAAVELAKIRQQARLVSKIEDLQAGEALPKGAPRPAPASEVAALQEKLRQVTRDLDANPLRSDAQRLAAMKTRLEKRIVDAERGLAPRAARAPLPDTAETAALRQKLAQVMDEHGLAPDPDAARVAAAERATEKSLADLEARVGAGDLSSQAPTSSPWSARLGEMRARQADFQAKLAEMRAAARPATDPEVAKLRAAERAAAKSVEKLEKKVAAGDISSSAPTASRWSPELGKMRQEQAALRERLSALRADARPVVDPEAARLTALKKRLAVRETELTQQIAEGYIPKKVRRPVALDKDAIALHGKVNGLKRQADLIIRKQELAGRSATEKGLDLTAGWGRFIKLTGVSTVQKLGAAAAERALVFRPIEELLGAGWSKVPGVSKFAKEASIEGGGSLSAVAKSYGGFFGKAAREEMAAHFRGVEGPMESALGKPHLGGEVPEWMAYPGHIHAGLKAPAKIAGYEYAMEKQAQHYLQRGQPEMLRDPVAIEEMKARAWEHANRDIFMNDNAAVNKFRKAFADEPGQSTAAKVGNTVAKVLMPIVKVPTNYALEATDYLAGIPKAGLGMVKTIRAGRAALNESGELADVVKAGLDALPPGQADQIMRQLKKGSLGAGLISLGATGAVEVGGYYDGKRKEGDLQPGQIRIAGHVVPHMILHHPAIEALQVGGAIYRAKTIPDGFGTAAKGLAENIPFIETPVMLARDLWGREPTKALGGVLRGMSIPPDIQRAARVGDQRVPPWDGPKVPLGAYQPPITPLLQELGWQDINAKKRKPHGDFVHKMVGEEELGIPGLRENVR